jgi:threonine aldolase
MIDLRSDTVTKPSAAMREAMARAEVGDDVYGEDPSVRALEERVAALLGKEAALFVPSGTMANQLALLTATRRGDEVICGEHAHLCWYESGAGAAWSGVQFAIAGKGGLFNVDELSEAIKPDLYVYPRSSLVALENTHNRAGGRVFPQPLVLAICERARELRLRTHLDGARIWNAAVASQTTPGALAAPFDSVSVCFSKGLGAPVGSALAATRAQIGEALRLRKMLGGGMRQAGILAAGALYALEHMRARIADDHAHARLFAKRLDEGLRTNTRADLVRVEVPETNIVNIKLPHPTALRAIDLARDGALLLSASAHGVLRAVFHLDVSRDDAERAASVLSAALRNACGTV